jgi:hypothetical protein
MALPVRARIPSVLDRRSQNKTKKEGENIMTSDGRSEPKDQWRTEVDGHIMKGIVMASQDRGKTDKKGHNGMLLGEKSH